MVSFVLNYVHLHALRSLSSLTCHPKSWLIDVLLSLAGSPSAFKPSNPHSSSGQLLHTTQRESLVEKCLQKKSSIDQSHALVPLWYHCPKDSRLVESFSQRIKHLDGSVFSLISFLKNLHFTFEVDWNLSSKDSFPLGLFRFRSELYHILLSLPK